MESRQYFSFMAFQRHVYFYFSIVLKVEDKLFLGFKMFLAL